MKILYRKNLKMTEGKIAAQSVHAAHGYAFFVDHTATSPLMSVVVLGVSDKKFKEFQEEKNCYTVYDAGYTEIPSGTETCLAFMEED